MGNSSATNVELSLALPLGVVVNQLMKVEADLRFLSAKAAVCAPDGGKAGLASQVAARLEQINATIEAIQSLVATMEADLQPRSPATASRQARDDRDD